MRLLCPLAFLQKGVGNNPSGILLPAHPASFTHSFVSGMQSVYFRESQDAIVLHTQVIKNSVLDSFVCSWTH